MSVGFLLGGFCDAACFRGSCLTSRAVRELRHLWQMEAAKNLDRTLAIDPALSWQHDHSARWCVCVCLSVCVCVCVCVCVFCVCL